MTVALLCLVAPGTAPTAAPGWPWASNHRNAIMTARRPRKVCSAALKASPLDQEYAAGTSSAQQGPNGDTHSVEEELLAPGRQYALAGDLESAVIHFERAATQAPRSAVCKAELGRVLVRLGRAEEGFNSLVDAFGIDSLCPGIKDGFREYYRAEIQADPDNIDLHEGLAALCVDSGHPEEAAACYRRCLDLHAAATAIPARESTPSAFPTDSGSADDGSADPAAVEAAARTDRWSVALFKCNASLCQWGDWDAEAVALRTAVRRRRRRGEGQDERAEAPRDSRASGGRGPHSDGNGLIGSLLLGHDDCDDNDDVDSSSSYHGTPRNQQRRRGNRAPSGVDGGDIDAAFFRPALHPFDSLSAPLSIGDCLAVAQQQSRGVLAEARTEQGSGGKHKRAQEKGEAREQGHQRQRWQRPTLTSSSRDARGRIRLGYVSGDFMGTHPLTHLMQSTFGMHDQDGFEVFLYALNPGDGSAQRHRLEVEAEHFRDLSTLTAREAAAAIANDGVGVVVNLGGYAGTIKSADIFALRPAPVAVSYMGFPGTMGSAEMVDYILADRTVIPPNLRRFYSEKVLEMPHCYFVNDYRQSERVVVDSPTPDRADHGLSPLQLLPAELPVDDDYADARAAAAAAAAAGLFADEGREIRKGYQTGRRAGDGGGGGITSGAVAGRRGHERGGTAEEVLERRRREGKECGRVVLCNFNRLHKLDPHTFGAWMKVLRTVPGTVLWLLDGGETARANLRREARSAGVEEERLVFAPLVGKEEHLQRLRLADLFVDTPLYNAHTVGCDALWAGVPMVTLQGAKMASRVGASLVEAAGMPELVTDSLEDYTRLVTALARDEKHREGLRQKLASMRMTCPLFDTRRWVRDAEGLLRWAWERHEAGLPPIHHG